MIDKPSVGLATWTMFPVRCAAVVVLKKWLADGIWSPNNTYKGLMHHQRFFLGANYRHLATQKNPVRLAEMIFVKKNILKSPYLDERKFEFRVYVQFYSQRVSTRTCTLYSTQKQGDACCGGYTWCFFSPWLYHLFEVAILKSCFPMLH
jgi:hypothetical protein